MLRLARTGAVIARVPRIALSPWARTVGVIGAPFRGYDALVLPRCRSVHTWFLMVDLDLVFVDEEGKVLGTVIGARPWRWFLGPRGARSVIELPAGALCGIAVATGDSIVGLPSPQ